MPFFTIKRDARGRLQPEAIQTDERLPTPAEEAEAYREEMARSRENQPNRVITKEELEDNKPVVAHRCTECGFHAGSAQGLTSHIRNKHKVNGTAGE